MKYLIVTCSNTLSLFKSRLKTRDGITTLINTAYRSGTLTVFLSVLFVLYTAQLTLLYILKCKINIKHQFVNAPVCRHF